MSQPHQITPEEAQILCNAFKEKMNAFYKLAEHISTLATGALALSVTFIKDKSPHTDWLLKGAWIAFVLAVIGFVLIHIARVTSYDTVLDSVRGGQGMRPTVSPGLYFHIGRYLLIWGFIMGLVMLAGYGVIQK